MSGIETELRKLVRTVTGAGGTRRRKARKPRRRKTTPRTKTGRFRKVRRRSR